MAPVLEFQEFLRILRFARNCIKRVPSRGRASLASLLALLGRKLIICWRFWFGHPKSAERPSVGSQASSYSVSGDSAVVREHVIAASYVPAASASNPSLHERTDEQPGTVTQFVAQTASVHLPVLESLPVDDLHGHSPLHPLDGRSFVNRSSGNLSTISIESRASDRFSIITNSRESIRAPHGQPSRLPRAPHRQLGRGPDPSRSRERATRPSSPTGTTRPHTPTYPPSILLHPTHGDGRVCPVFQPEPSTSYTHQPPSHPHKIRTRRRGPTTSVILASQTPSTESLSITHSSDLPQETDEPFAIDSPTNSSVVDPTPPRSPTSSDHSSMDYGLRVPDGRSVELVNSEQIPRYSKNATM